MAVSKRARVNRRGFLKGAATATAAAGTAAFTATVPATASAEAAAQTGGGATAAGSAPPPTQAQIDRDAGAVQPPAVTGPAVVRPGSDRFGVETAHSGSLRFRHERLLD